MPLPNSFGAGRYVVRSFLGEGGRKRVYLAHDERLDRDVAIAVIRSEGLDDDARSRVQREAQAMGRLGDHPHIVTVHDVFEDEGVPIIVSRYMAGGAVDDVLKNSEEHRLPIERVIEIAAQICEALAHAHSRGVIHRDLKPGNVWLTADGAAMLGDFGLAMALDRSRMTMQGMMVGTLAYMSPEQALGRGSDPRSDLYALGAMLYEMVTGRPPFMGEDAVAIISQHINTPPVAPSWHNPQVVKPLESLILRLLNKAPDERPASAADVAAQLRTVTQVRDGQSVVQEIAATASAPNDVRGVDWSVFVAREKEMEQLKDSLERANSGRASLVTVVGDPGIGKTRLVEEFSVYARLRGWQMLTGRSYETQASVAYRPFVDALRQYVRSQPDEEIARQLGSGVGQVAHLVSELRERFPAAPHAPNADPDTERLRMFESVAHFLRSAAQETPMLLVLEDLQWADAPTVHMLQHVVRGTANDRVMLVCAFQEDELAKDHALAVAMPELRRHQGFKRLPLAPFTRSEVNALLGAIEPSEESLNERRALAAVLTPQTGGNPLFLQEGVNYLIETGKIVHEGGRWTSHVTDVADLAIPPGIRDTFLRRVERLSDPCVKALTRASALGRSFSWEVFLAVSDAPEDTLIELLEEALEARLLTELPSTAVSAASYEFVSSQLRQTLYEQLSGPRRALLHREIGEALERLFEAELDAHLAELAYHFGQATSQAHALKAADYAGRAGDRAREMSAWDDAARHYELAVRSLDRAHAPNDEARCHVLLALAECNHLLGRYHPNVELLRQAGEIARGLPSAELLAEAAMQFERMAQVSELDLVSERLALLDEALMMLGAEDSTQRVLVLCHRVQAAAAAAAARAGRASIGFLAYAGEKEAAVLGQAREALAIAERLGDDRLMATAAYFLHAYDWTPDNDRERLALAERGLAAARNARDGRMEADLTLARAYDLLPLGEVVEFRRNAEILAATVQRAGYYGAEYWHAAMLVIIETAEGSLATADERLADYSSRPGSATAGFTAIGQRYYLRLLQGRVSEMEDVLRAVVVQWRGVPLIRAGLALIHASGGRTDEALREIDELTADNLGGVSRDLLWMATLVTLVDACAEADESAPAQALYDALLPYASGNVAISGTATAGSAARVLGRLATLLERWELAEEHYQAAIEANEGMGFGAWVAMTRLHYGDMLQRRNGPGDRARAAALLQQALDAAQEMGMAKVMNDALAFKMQAQGVSLTAGDIYTSIDRLAESVHAEPPALRQEAVSPDGTVTIMFSDIEGSTALADRLGDKQFMDVLREHNAIIRAHIQAHGGYEVKSEGDGFMVAFQSARRAIDCAVEIQHALAARNETADESVRVRMGLHSGEVIKEGEDFFGRNVILAARVAAQATGGEILVSSVLKALVESAGDLAFDEPRSAELKGLSGTHLMHPLNFGSVVPSQDQVETGAPSWSPPSAVEDASAPERSAERPFEAQPVSMKDVRYCTTRDGVRIAFAARGEGLTIIECQSVVGSFFDRSSSVVGGAYAMRVGDGRRVVQYDMRGTGLSQRDVSDLSHEALMLDIEAIADALELDQFVLLAPAMSGPRGIGFAAAHPGRVSALILNGTTAAFANVWPAEVMQGLIGLARMNWPQAAFAIANGLNDPRDDGQAVDAVVELYVRSAQGETVAALLEGSYGTDVSTLLPRVSAKTLVLHITGDEVIPLAEGEKLAGGIPRARFVALDHPTRGVYAGTYADDVGDAIDRFLREDDAVPAVQYCTTSDGVRIAYFIEGDGPTLVMTQAAFESQVSGFAREAYTPIMQGRRLVSYYARGVGLSDRDAASFRLEDLLRDLEAVIEAVDGGPVTIFGTTFSAPAAIAYAARHPERVERLIIHRGFARGSDVMSREQLDGILSLIRTNWEMAAQVLGDAGVRSDAPEFGRQVADEIRDNVTPEVAARFLSDLYESADVSGVLESITTPTLVVHRRDDTVFPVSGSERIAAGIPGARLVTPAGSGPISAGDDVAENMQVLIEFLNEPLGQ